MWKPPEKIKWEPKRGQTPSRSDLRQSMLFSPLDSGRLHLKNRTWVPAMVPWRATDAGEVTKDVLDWYGRFARGKPAVIVVEATGIRDVPSGPLMRIGHDRFLDGLKALVSRVRDESDGDTKLFIQLIDFLAVKRRPERDAYLSRFLKITPDLRKRLEMIDLDEPAIRSHLIAMSESELREVLCARDWESLNFGYRERVGDTHLDHIEELPRVLPNLFSEAALRAQYAGFDGVELHYAHAYTMASFLSATNTRSDGFGSSREGRVRLPLEVYRSVRQAVKDDFVVGARFLADEVIDGGSTIEDACYYAEQFSKAGMDFLSLSRGGKFDDAKQPKVGAAVYPYTGRSGYECMPQYMSDDIGPFGRNFPASARIRSTIRSSGMETPVVAAGGVHNFEIAEAALIGGVCDVVGVARQALADPDWILKLVSGRGEQIRLCEYTNYCEGLDQNHKQVTCKLWDRLDLNEPDISLSRDGKRRLVAPDWRPNGAE